MSLTTSQSVAQLLLSRDKSNPCCLELDAVVPHSNGTSTLYRGGYPIHYQVNTSLSWAPQTLNNAPRACVAYRKHLLSDSPHNTTLSQGDFYSLTRPNTLRQRHLWLQAGGQTVAAAARGPTPNLSQREKYLYVCAIIRYILCGGKKKKQNTSQISVVQETSHTPKTLIKETTATPCWWISCL